MTPQEKIQKFKKHAPEFHQTFGMSIGPFADMLFGFDIVKFDECIGVPKTGNVSCSDFVLKQYGERALELVKLLLQESGG